MAWSYSGNPEESPKDAVRFLIGDTDENDKLLHDAEIEYLLKKYNNAPLNAAIRCCETIMAKFSRLADEKVGQVSIDYSQKAKGYLAMRDELRRRMMIETSAPYAGGISRLDKQINVANADRVKPDFTKQMMDNNQASNIIGPGGPNRFDSDSGEDID